LVRVVLKSLLVVGLAKSAEKIIKDTNQIYVSGVKNTEFGVIENKNIDIEKLCGVKGFVIVRFPTTNGKKNVLNVIN
tara:strand:- start:1200 stop:1430 length:231 start_codon:yes stop_codon:yes gene_type:complete